MLATSRPLWPTMQECEACDGRYGEYAAVLLQPLSRLWEATGLFAILPPCPPTPPTPSITFHTCDSTARTHSTVLLCSQPAHSMSSMV